MKLANAFENASSSLGSTSKISKRRCHESSMKSTLSDPPQLMAQQIEPMGQGLHRYLTAWQDWGLQ
jgi:hypothetical protein